MEKERKKVKIFIKEVTAIGEMSECLNVEKINKINKIKLNKLNKIK